RLNRIFVPEARADFFFAAIASPLNCRPLRRPAGRSPRRSCLVGWRHVRVTRPVSQVLRAPIRGQVDFPRSDLALLRTPVSNDGASPDPPGPLISRVVEEVEGPVVHVALPDPQLVDVVSQEVRLRPAQFVA